MNKTSTLSEKLLYPEQFGNNVATLFHTKFHILRQIIE